jgi:proteasome accessory factor B
MAKPLKVPCPPPKAERFSRPPLQRMLLLHQQLKANRFPNCRKLAEELEVATKTIQRDIDFMRDRLGLPIEYDPLRFGFYYTEPVTSFPSVEVSEGEIVAIFIAQKALAQYQGTSFSKPLQAAFQKITEGLQEKVDFHWADVDSAISFKGIGTTAADLDLFESVSKAVMRSCELSFEYKKLNSSSFEARRVQPYHLGSVENQWYLFGFDLARQQLRTFALTRMRKARDTNVRFERPADFSISKHLSDSFGVFSGKERHKVRIRFDAFSAQLVNERQWHASQKIKALADGGVELSMQLGSIEEIERWVLSWGTHATVLEPKMLRDRLRHSAEELAGRYR